MGSQRSSSRPNPVAVTMPILLVIVVGIFAAPFVPENLFSLYKGGVITVIVAAIVFVFWLVLRGIAGSQTEAQTED